MSESPQVVLRHRGRVAYQTALDEMRRFTDQRDASTTDEIWLLEHPPVFTLGTNGDPSHVLAAGDIPVMQVDRGGQVTYHGPGQLVVYTLLDLKRLRLGIRDLVCKLERGVITMLAGFGITATSRDGAPGVYVNDAKIASIGLRVRRNCSYHGLAVNVQPDLEPFSRINPCGYEGLAVTSMAKLNAAGEFETVADALLQALCAQLGLTPPADAFRRESSAASRAGVPTSHQ